MLCGSLRAEVCAHFGCGTRGGRSTNAGEKGGSRGHRRPRLPQVMLALALPGLRAAVGWRAAEWAAAGGGVYDLAGRDVTLGPRSGRGGGEQELLGRGAPAAALLVRRRPGHARHPADRLQRCRQLRAHLERLGDGGLPFFSNSARRMSTSSCSSPTLRCAASSRRSPSGAGLNFNPSRPAAFTTSVGRTPNGLM